jgi:hypothetical protein
MTETGIDASVVWEPDGHLSELALSVLVDGEAALLPTDAASHAQLCADCGKRLGALAQLSLEIDGALSHAPVALARTATHPQASGWQRWPAHAPVKEIGLGLVLALLGQLPTLLGLSPAGIRHSIKATLQLSLRVSEHAIHVSTQAFGPSLPWLATLILLAASSCIIGAASSTRTTLPRNATPQSSGSAPPR